ncbi:MAG: SLC13 family permease, partial [Rhodospirillales bacterium]|nr:SLC13 family permease [Rhodospirillales bacterium]
MAGKTVADFVTATEGTVTITALLRDGVRKERLLPDAPLRQGDVLLLQGAPDDLERAIVTTGVALTRQHRLPDAEQPTDDLSVVEAVVTPQSMLIGRTAEDLRLLDRFNVNLLAVSRQGERSTSRLGATVLRAGDVVILQGDVNQLSDVLATLDCLPLASRQVGLTRTRPGLRPVLILAA